jgi:uncharacterized protein YdaU (DUF1376 family)
MNYVPWHIGDYKSATAHLSNEEDIAYRRLLEMYYDTEMPIPADYIGLARRLRVDLAALDVVLGDFFTLGPDGFRNGRADEEIALYHEKKAIAERAGKASGVARRNGRSTTVQRPFNGRSTETNDRSTDVQRKGDSVQPTKNQEPRTKNHSPEPVGSGSAEGSPSALVAVPAPSQAPAKPKQACRLPEQWGPTDRHRALAAETGKDLDAAAGRFRNHHKAKGSRFLDWDLAFSNWLSERFARDPQRPLIPVNTQLVDYGQGGAL